MDQERENYRDEPDPPPLRRSEILANVASDGWAAIGIGVAVLWLVIVIVRLVYS